MIYFLKILNKDLCSFIQKAIAFQMIKYYNSYKKKMDINLHPKQKYNHNKKIIFDSVTI